MSQVRNIAKKYKVSVDDNRIEKLELWTGNHPSGVRKKDIRDWAKKFLEEQGYEVTEPCT